MSKFVPKGQGEDGEPGSRKIYVGKFMRDYKLLPTAWHFSVCT